MYLKNLELDDLVKYGLIPEFIGRLPIISTLEDLDEESLIKILVEPKNSLTKQYQELFKLDGAKLIFKENALKEIEAGSYEYHQKTVDYAINKLDISPIRIERNYGHPN